MFIVVDLAKVCTMPHCLGGMQNWQRTEKGEQPR